MQITIFGSHFNKKDQDQLKLIPILKKKYPKIRILTQDPTEDLHIPKEPWIIIDKAMGIDKITIFNNLDKFIQPKTVTAHDYDVYTELMLQKKLNNLPKQIKIIAIPLNKKINTDEIITIIKAKI